MNRPVIEAQNLSKSFGDERVLDGLNLAIEPGQIVALIGTNAAGKTTLIKCLLGLLRISEGAGRIFGEDSWNLSANTKSRLGYVSQEFEMLNWMTVRQITDYTGAFYEHWQPQRVAQLISEWQLPLHKRINTLSVGQRQKLAAILAMGHQPELLILDEPVASLDPSARRQFLRSLIEFTADETRTILFSSHITSDLERIASHVAFLRSGQVAWFGPLDLLKERCKRIRIFAAESLPATLDIPGAIHAEVQGRTAIASVIDFDDTTRAELAQRFGGEIRVEDLNLEEIFLEWTEHPTSGTRQALETAR